MSEINNNNNEKLHLEAGEKEMLLDHNYDGIHELDNPLPAWWQMSFYGAIIFGIGYFIAYQIMGAPSLRQQFDAEYKEHAEKQEIINKTASNFDKATYDRLVADGGVKKGEVLFNNNCVPCHKEKGTGDIGPNLTDEYWINSQGTPETNFPVVFKGVPEKGMPTWSESLSPEEIYQVVSYVQTLHNLKLPGKAPQGNKIEDKPN